LLVSRICENKYANRPKITISINIFYSPENVKKPILWYDLYTW